jgi:GNAT superfamily N-acetyltransferase
MPGTSSHASVVIRPAERRDVDPLGRLGGLLMRAHAAFDARRFLPPGDDPDSGYGRFLLSQLDDPTVVVLVAEIDGAVVGYVYAGIEPLSWKELRDEAGFVHDIVVGESVRGTGVGRQLLDAAIEWLRARGVPRVMLWTAVANAPARRLFAARGFRETMVEMTLEL